MGQLHDAPDVDGFLDLGNQRVVPLPGDCTFYGRDEAEVPLGLLELAAPGKVTKHGQTGGGLNLRLAERQMSRTADAVEDDAGHVQVGVEHLIAQHLGGDAAGDLGGVGDQEHRRAQQLGKLGGGAFLIETGMAVEQAHDSLDDGNLPSRRRLAVKLQHRGMRQQPGVEVAGGDTASNLVIGRVNVVRPGLEGLHSIASPGQRAHDACGDGGLAYPAAYTGYHYGWSHVFSPLIPLYWILAPALPNAEIAHHLTLTCRPLFIADRRLREP